MVGRYFQRAKRLWQAYMTIADYYATLYYSNYEVDKAKLAGVFDQAVAAYKRVPSWFWRGTLVGTPKFHITFMKAATRHYREGAEARRQEALNRRRRNYYYRYIYEEGLPYGYQRRERPDWWYKR